VDVRPEVQVIVDAAAQAKREGRRFTWAERAELIKKQFPTRTKADWVRRFTDDPDMFSDLMRDLLKIDQQVPGKSGPRPGPEFEAGMDLIRKIRGEDYCTLKFSEALAILGHGMSLTALARKTKLSRSQVHRLLNAQMQPSAEEMEAVATAFKKEPSFFLEWRAAYIAGTLASKLEEAPEIGIGLYRKLVGSARV